MKGYHTHQRAQLLALLQHHPDQQFSAEQLAAQLGDAISISAIYRNLARLTAQGQVQRFAAADGQRALYQYFDAGRCQSHLHMKCQQCGLLYHLEDPAAAQALNAALKNAAFDLDMKASVLYGRCRGCRNQAALLEEHR